MSPSETAPDIAPGVTAPSVASIQVGTIRDYEGPPRKWRSAIAKDQYLPTCTVHSAGVDGDAQADLVHHGGTEKAILMYAASHYEYWQDQLDRDLPAGSFGENLTVTGIDETQICIGDRIRLGTTLLECTQPRQPCWKLSRHLDSARLAQRVEEKGTTGWYVRVIKPGTITRGDHLHIEDRPSPQATIAWANQVMHHLPADTTANAALLEVPALSASWQRTLTKRLNKEAVETESRLSGPG